MLNIKKTLLEVRTAAIDSHRSLLNRKLDDATPYSFGLIVILKEKILLLRS
jgi:hypothetical protein